MADNHVMNTVVRLVGQLDPSLAKSVQNAEKQFKKMDKTAFAVNASFVAMGAVAIKAFADGTEQAVKFQKQMSNVATLLDGDVNKRIGELGKDVLKVSNRTGVATADLTDGLYQVISAFGDSAEATKQLEIASKAAKAGNATTTDSINMLSAVTKGYGDTSAEAQQKAADLAFETVKLGQTSFPELAASMGKVIPLAATMGVKQEELFGAMATLTGVTGSTAEVTTQLRGAVQGFLQPTKDMCEVMKALGYENGQQMIEANGLQKSLDMLKTAVGGNEIAFAGLFSSVEAKNAVLALTGAQSENLTEKTKAMYQATGAADEAFKQQTNNIEDLRAMVDNLWSNSLTQLGMVVLPIVKMALESALPILQAMAEHMDILIPIITGVVAGLGSFSIIQSVVTLMNIWKASTIASALANGGLVASLQAVWVAMSTNPIGWICIAIGALIAIIVACVQHWDEIKAAWDRFKESLMQTSFVQNIIAGFNTIWETVKNVFGVIKTFIQEHFIDILLLALGPIGMVIKGITTIGSKIAGLKKSKEATDEIPKFAKGGFTNGISIAGEEGREAVISFNPAYRSDNISTWLKAGEMLGLSASGRESSFSISGITFSPNLYFTQKMSDEDVVDAVKRSGEDFVDFIQEKLEELSASSYSATSCRY